MTLSGTKTEANLLEAFAGESMARNIYTYYAGKAKSEGYVQIANIFEETADNEKEHAKIWFKLLHDGNVADTAKNLRDAAGGEHSEWSDMYKRMAREARAEGFDDIAALFEQVAEIESHHEDRYQALLNNLVSGSIFNLGSKASWVCLNCGHVHESAEAPYKCPVCNHPRAYFKLNIKDY